MNILIDTSAIIALLNHRDMHHWWTKEQISELKYPFYTCEGVLSEAFHLLEKTTAGQRSLVELLKKDLIQVDFVYSDFQSDIQRIITSYNDLPASFADACLVCMAENTTGDTKVFTLDNHFNIYRTSEGKAVSLIIP